jgi:predicted MFS family arabinose efflux permease
MDAGTVILAAIVVSAIGMLFYNLLPVYLGTAQDSRGLDNSQLGFMTSAFFLGYNAVTISAYYWIRKWNWRLVTLVAVPVAAISLFSEMYLDLYLALLATTAVAGGALAVLYGIGTTILADSSNPTRWFGLKIAAEGLLGAVLLFILPGTLIADYGFNGTIMGMLATVLLLSPLLFLLPARGTKTHEQELEEFNTWEEIPESINHWAIWSALAAILVFISGASAVWAFMERLGNTAGFAPAAIARLLALSLGFATLGSLGVAALGKRFGNTRPFIACLLAVLCALLLLGNAENFLVYAIGCCIFTAAFGAGVPFAVAEVAELDVDGRYAVLTVPAIGLGAMLGPGVAGLVYTGDSPVAILSLVAMTMIVAVALVALAEKRRHS